MTRGACPPSRRNEIDPRTGDREMEAAGDDVLAAARERVGVGGELRQALDGSGSDGAVVRRRVRLLSDN